MIGRGLVDVSKLGRLFEEIGPQLYRFPAIDPGELRHAIHELRSTD
jgi:hypothetical protein